MTEWMRGNMLEKRRADGDLGGTMRLGAYEAMLAPGSRVAEIYGALRIRERHRHRYEVNINYKGKLEDAGLVFSGMSPDGDLPEIVEFPAPPLVHRRPVPSRADVQALRAASAVHLFHQSGARSVPAGLNTKDLRRNNRIGRRPGRRDRQGSRRNS